MATRQKKPLSVNSFAVKITVGTQIVQSFFTKCTGVKKEYNTGTYSDGQSNIIYTLPTSIKYADITLSKPMTEDDDVLIQAINAANTKVNEFLTVDIQPVYRDGYFSQPLGGSISVQYCTVKSVSFPEIDSAGDGVAMIECVLSPGYISSSGSKRYWIEPDTIATTTA